MIFPGKRNWGYDGVLPFAPDRAYGSPDDLKALVDAAHGHGLMVFLDVVYNHFGPDGNYLASYAPTFFRDDVATPWGAGDRFPPRGGAALLHRERALLADGISLRRPALRCRARDHRSRTGSTRWRPQVRATVEKDRHVHLVLEHDGNVADHLRRDFDAQWNDDGHHVLHVMLTGEREGYYGDYADRAGRAAGALPRRGLRLSGRAVRASQRRAARHAERRSAADRVRAVPAEPRPDRQPRLRRSPDRNASSRRRSKPRSRCSCSARRSRSSSWARKPPARRRSSSSPIITANWPTPCARGGGASSRASRRSPIRRGARRFPIRTRPRRSSARGRRRDAERGADRAALYRRLLALRRERIVPHLAGAKAIGAEAIGPSAVLARWRLGDGSILTLAANLGAEPCALARRRRAIFDLRRRCRSGQLGGHTTLAFLERPRG